MCKWGSWKELDGLTIKIFLHLNNIYILFSHIFFDGLTIQNFIYKIIFINSIQPIQNFARISYIPVITEFNFINTLRKCIFIKKRSLRVIEWKKRKESKNIIFTFKSSFIKSIKNKNKCNFVIAQSALILKNLFLVSKKKYLNIAIIAGVKKNNQFFNNYSVIFLSVNNSDNIDDLCKNINKKIKDNSGFLQVSYFSVNHLNLKFSFFEKIDCVFSSMINVDNKVFIENNNEFVSNDLWNPYCTAPLYIFSSSSVEEDKSTTMISAHSPDIDNQKLLDSFYDLSFLKDKYHYGFGEEQLKLK